MGLVELAYDAVGRLGIGTLIFGSIVFYQIYKVIYRLYFHPLRNYPGPLSTRISSLPFIYNNLTGNVPYWHVKMHEKYGEVFRYTPNELSFSAADSFKDLYGHRKAGQLNWKKNPKFYLEPVPDEAHRVFNIVNGNDADHTRMRRILSNAFSDRALKLQEPLFMKYIDILCDKFREFYDKDPNHKFDMINMWNFTTFDVMADLTFGESLGMVERCEYHPWISAMLSLFHFGVYLHSIRYSKLLESIAITLIPKIDPKVAENQKLHKQLVHERVDKRLAVKDPRPDIWGLVLEKMGNEKADQYMTRKEMYENANIFMIAGTETTATLLSGMTWYLCKQRDKMDKLCNEIRTVCVKEDDITIERLQAMPYLNACIEEGLRMFPPISTGLSRIAPKGGAMVAGHFVPEGGIACATQMAVYRNANNFKNPYEFLPERWIDKEYATDKKYSLQPFSTGPRNCIGKNMAYHESRLLLAKVLWHFDFYLCPESDRWIDQKIFIMWEKPSLWCTVKPVVRN